VHLAHVWRSQERRIFGDGDRGGDEVMDILHEIGTVERDVSIEYSQVESTKYPNPGFLLLFAFTTPQTIP